MSLVPSSGGQPTPSTGATPAFRVGVSSPGVQSPGPVFSVRRSRNWSCEFDRRIVAHPCRPSSPLSACRSRKQLRPRHHAPQDWVGTPKLNPRYSAAQTGVMKPSTVRLAGLRVSQLVWPGPAAPFRWWDDRSLSPSAVWCDRRARWKRHRILGRTFVRSRVLLNPLLRTEPCLSWCCRSRLRPPEEPGRFELWPLGRSAGPA